MEFAPILQTTNSREEACVTSAGFVTVGNSDISALSTFRRWRSCSNQDAGFSATSTSNTKTIMQSKCSSVMMGNASKLPACVPSIPSNFSSLSRSADKDVLSSLKNTKKYTSSNSFPSLWEKSKSLKCFNAEITNSASITLSHWTSPTRQTSK